ncbi:MAG: hypothetical protein K2Z81_01210, partial [Cyanobacteria bacterium]|nr:hypothetical protein [Cyanobacteriota bacterium]
MMRQNNMLRATKDENELTISQNRGGTLTLCELDKRPALFDGLTSGKSLRQVITRVTLASSVFALATSTLVAALVGAFHVTFYGLGPIELAILHSLSIVYFVTIMLPFCLLLAWHKRHNQEAPYQQETLDLPLSIENAMDLSAAALWSLPRTNFKKVDQRKNLMKFHSQGNSRCAPQEL